MSALQAECRRFESVYLHQQTAPFFLASPVREIFFCRDFDVGKGTGPAESDAANEKTTAVFVVLGAIRLQLEQVFAEGYGYCLRTVGRAEFFIQFVKVLLYPAFRYSEQCGDVFV